MDKTISEHIRQLEIMKELYLMIDDYITGEYIDDLIKRMEAKQN